MAKHCLDEKHNFGTMQLIKEVRDNRNLDTWESLLIGRGENSVNIDDPPIWSPLFKLTTNIGKWEKTSVSLDQSLKMEALLPKWSLDE
jgi:hypothetical protein